MNEVKSPDDKSNWDGINIYVFSNGQQYSPPRKYHIRNDELNWWEATLSYLGRSQYGSMHAAVQLYTTDGKKVNSPIQLQNSGVYVAVEPPEVFIDSGYNKYLIKASRSLEKRQSRKSSSLEISKPDEIIIKNEHHSSNINHNIENFKTPDQSVTIETVAASTENQNNTIKNPQAITATQKHIQKNNIQTRQTEKTKSFNNQRIPILRKINANSTSSPPVTKRTFIKRKDSPIKRNLKATPKKIPEKPLSSINNIGKFVSIESKMLSKNIVSDIKESVPIERVTSQKIEKHDEESEHRTVCTLSNKIVSSSHKSLVTDSAEMSSLIEDKELIMISNVNTNLESDIISVPIESGDIRKQTDTTPLREALAEPSEISTVILPIRNEETRIISNTVIGNIINHIVEKLHMPEVQSNISKDNSKSKVIKTQPHHSSNNIVISEKHPTNNYAIAVDEGDIVNFKLHIEIRNGKGVVSTDCKKKLHRTDKERADKSSQVNIDVGFNRVPIFTNNHEVLVQNQSRQSILTSECVQRHGNAKVVVQCACCKHYNLEDVIEMDSSEVDKHVIVVPRAENYERRNNNEEAYHTIEKDVNKPDYTTPQIVYNTVRKIASGSSLQEKPEYMITRLNNPIPVPNVVSSMSVIEEDHLKKEHVVTKHKIFITEDKAHQSEYIISQQEPASEQTNETQKTELLVIRKNELTQLPKIMTERFTQTDWCALLLEARRHEDGRYTFHLPPLCVLQYYKL